MPLEPKVSRVLLRVEMADGGVREFVAREPYDVEVTVTPSERLLGQPDLRLPPSYITAGEATAVTIGLKASRSLSQNAPIMISTDTGGERCVTCGASSVLWQPQHRQAI
jgi:hypothetical protein